MALSAAFLIVNGLFLDNRVTRFFSHWSWYPVSRVSYGTFLIHSYVLFFLLKQGDLQNARDLGSAGFFLLFSYVMAGSTHLAMVMFVTIEQPLIRLGARVSLRFRKPTIEASPPPIGTPS